MFNLDWLKQQFSAFCPCPDLPPPEDEFGRFMDFLEAALGRDVTDEEMQWIFDNFSPQEGP